MISISYVNGNYVARASFEDKDILKSSGFFWDRYLKKWTTPQAEVAYRLYKYCTPETQKQISNLLDIKEYTFNKNQIKWPLRKTPYAHQIDGAHFALTRKNSYLAFEAGTGKTATAIMCINSKPGKAIIVCPAFLKFNWLNELNQWLNANAKIEIIHTSKTQINLKADIFILPASLLHMEPVRSQFFNDPDFKVTWLIIDEAHYYKNAEAKRTQSLFGGRVFNSHTSKKIIWKGFQKIAEHTVCLSGTPMPNRPIELYPVVSKTAPHAIDFLDKHGFALKYCDAFEGEWGWDYSGSSNLDELNEKLTQNYMSVKKLNECVDLPEKMPNHFLFLDDEPKKLKKMQMQLLDRVSLKDLILANEELSAKARARGGIDDSGLSYMSELRHLTGLAKVEPAASIISEMAESGEHMLCFGWHNDVIEGVANLLKKSKLKVFTITGKTPHKRRQEIVDTFQSSSEQCVLVANIQAAGVGLTLTRAFRPIFIEPSWVPSDNEQAISRVHRIGQTQKVQATFLVWPGSIDYLILNAHQDKSRVINKVITTKPNEGVHMDNKAVRKYLMSKLDTVQREAEILQAAIKSLDAETETQAASAPTTKKEAAPATKTTTKKLTKKEVEQTELEAEDVTEDAAAEESEESDLDLDSEDTEAEVTIDTVRQTVKKFALKHGKDKALKLLQKFKTTSISDLKKPDYAKVIELAEKHM